MGKLEGKVALITGAARGQGRSHALRLAQEGADVIAVDICAQVGSVSHPLATPEDLAETVAQVEALDRRIVARQADVRDTAGLQTAVDDGVAELGRLDTVRANAGIASFGPVADLTDEVWDDMMDINLTGVFKTVRAALPHLRAHGQGGSIVITSSTAGIKGLANLAHYVPDKPASEVTREEAAEIFQSMNALPIRWVDPVDISNAVLFQVSDDARYVTGVQLPVDAGSVIK